jgi:PAS domain S-box-containing protein
MWKKIRITTKISLIIIVITLAGTAGIGFFCFSYLQKAHRDKYLYSLSALARLRAEQVELFFENEKKHIEKILYYLDPSSAGMEGQSLTTAMEMVAGPYHKGALLINPSGQVLESTDLSFTEGSTFTDPDGSSFKPALQGVHFSSVFKDEEGYFLYALAPHGSGTQLLAVKISLNDLYNRFQVSQELGKTGEVLLVRKDPGTNRILLVSPLRHEPHAGIKIFPTDHPAVQGIEKIFNHATDHFIASDYRGKTVYLTGQALQPSGWAVVAKMDTEEASGDASGLIRILLLAGFSVLLFALLAGLLLSRALTRPLISMRNILTMVEQGILPERVEVNSRDEFGQMTEKVNNLVASLKNHARFAKLVGEGKYDTEFHPASENDQLGMALITMRNNLIENEKRDKERNWIVRGVAEISEILRLHDSLDTMGDDVIRFILEKIGAVQGAFYVVDDETEEEPIIEMRACYAYGRKKYLQNKFRFAEGLVGQAAIEKDTVLRTEIPPDYVTLTSGILGEQRPTCILIVPLITNEQVYGVLEFAGLKKFNPSQVRFVEELSLILARTIFNIRVNERTRRLLEEARAMSNELKEKQEVLRQNAEEMQATQEELERTNRELEKQIEEVNRTQKRMQLLLENASEVITIYEEDETIRYISPSVETILGYGQKELIGKSDMYLVHPDYREVYENLFRKMKSSPDEKVTAQFEYKTKDGTYIWIEATGTNCMSNPAIHGYILNLRDITERRRAEQEQRMRSKMQALSENSPDLITRLENEIISYINPVIESYTGKSPQWFINRKIKETELDDSILNNWLRIVEQVQATEQTVATEMEFPSELGRRIMQVSAIPEFDENSKLESVLVVSHDITERKLIELEIQNKNKKITESINYAKRIQSAILPNTRVINRLLPDSFILYKPRDVVSGDFPWFMQMKDEVFIAAVDCTGHGVPGALLSLIGYFLLNDIVRSRKVTDPGAILDLLDEGVTKTLRQDEEATTKDGMDIALCRINLNTREVAYAGAHRSLYAMRNGTMEEIKGNKFPIGGGIFKNQTNFTTTHLQLSKGDSIYFCSDGYPDQFGGPEGRKLGSRKLREIIESIHHLSMREAAIIFDTEWETWRGATKQTDDVLLIGIKF